MMPILSPPVASEIDFLTTYNVTIDDNVGIMITLKVFSIYTYGAWWELEILRTTGVAFSEWLTGFIDRQTHLAIHYLKNQMIGFVQLHVVS